MSINLNNEIKINLDNDNDTESSVSSVDLKDINNTKLKMDMKYIGKKYSNIVLSGGATKGLATLGALQYIYDNNMIDQNHGLKFYGTSIGAIISYLLIIGYRPVEIFVDLCTTQAMDNFSCVDLISLTQGSGGFEWSIINNFLEKLTLQKLGKYILMKDIKDIFKKSLNIATYNLTKHKIEIISSENPEHAEIPCLIALRMSSNVPLLFSQFKYFDCEYIDGGFSNNLPVNLVTDELNTLAVNTSIIREEKNDRTSDNKFRIHNYILRLFLENQYVNVSNNIKFAEEKKNIDLINLNTINYVTLKVTNSDAVNMFSDGYKDSQNFYCKN